MLGLALALVLTPAAAGNPTPEQVAALPPAASRPVSFSQDIKPLLESRCVQCHGHGRVKGGFRLDTRETLLKGGDSGTAVVPGQSQESHLIELVAGVDPDNVMPRKGTRLTGEEVGLLRAWIDQGLPWEASLNFGRLPALNLKPHAPAASVSANSGVNPIDQILGPYFRAHVFTPPPVVDDTLFARRAYLDVIGLLPPTDSTGGMISDLDPGLRRELVRRLLVDNRRFAEHWISFWNDLLRNDYRGTGYIDGGRKQITGWLMTALTTNMPYDRFVAQLIDPVPGSEGFTKGIVWRGVVNASQSQPLQAAQNIAQVFMGVNLKCASCHDSFINDWRLADAYGLASVFGDHPLEMFQCDKPTGKTVPAAFIYPELGSLDPVADKSARLKRLAEIMTGRQNGRLSRTIVNRLWAQFFGRGLVEPVDEMERPAWSPDLLDWLAEDLVAHGYDLKHTIEVILTSKAYQLPAVDVGERPGNDYVFRGPAVRRLTAEQFRDALGQLTGVWYAQAEFPAAGEQVRACLVAADPLAVALGRPNRDQVTSVRASTATTLQGLELTNGGTLAGVLESGAWRLVPSPPSTVDLIDRLFELALGRRPSRAETGLAIGAVGQPLRPEGLEDLLWAISMLPEFQLIY